MSRFSHQNNQLRLLSLAGLTECLLFYTSTLSENREGPYRLKINCVHTQPESLAAGFPLQQRLLWYVCVAQQISSCMLSCSAAVSCYFVSCLIACATVYHKNTPVTQYHSLKEKLKWLDKSKNAISHGHRDWPGYINGWIPRGLRSFLRTVQVCAERLSFPPFSDNQLVFTQIYWCRF